MNSVPNASPSLTTPLFADPPPRVEPRRPHHVRFNPTPEVQPAPQDTYVNTAAWPVHGPHRGVMSSDQFLTTLEQFRLQLLAVANNPEVPSEQDAAKITGKKVTNKTIDYLFFGAPRKFRAAQRAPRGSEERKHDYVDSGVRGVLALCLSPTIFVPIICGLAGAAKGTKDASFGGVKRTYQRDLIKKNVLKPMLDVLKNDSPIPLGLDHRAKIRNILDICQTDHDVSHVLKPYDTKKIQDWLDSRDRI
jgi:hypothetical protein